MTPLRPPTEKEAFKGALGAAVEQIESSLQENGLEKYAQTAEQLLEGYDPETLVALLLKTMAKDPADQVPVKITPERPLPSGKKGGYNKNGRRGGGGGGNRNRKDGGSYRGGKSKGGYGNKDSYNKDKKYSNDRRKNDRRDNDHKDGGKKRGFVIRSNND